MRAPSWLQRAVILGLISFLALAASIVGIGAAAAEPRPADDGPLASPLNAPAGSTESCVQAALTRKIAEWTCLGPILSHDGTREQISLDPAIGNRMQRQMAPMDEPEENDDTWCEFGSVCTNNINSYASKTKGNTAYGDGDGVIGTYDVILETNLNGRQAEWTVTIYRDTGPELVFTNQWVNCFEQVSNWPDSVCGSHEVPDAYLSDYRSWTSPTLRGNYLSDSSTYYGAYNGQYYTLEDDEFYQSVPDLEGARFNCFGSSDDICYFP